MATRRKQLEKTAALHGVQHYPSDGCGVELNPVQSLQVSPADTTSALKTSRAWQGKSWFVRTVVGLKRAFVLNGFRLGGKAGAKWMDNAAPATRRRLMRFVREVTEEYLAMDNVVVFWREGKPAFTLKPEDCEYTDKMGQEVLKVRLNLSRKDLEERGFTPAQVERYSKPQITLDEAEGEYFAVLKRARVGDGFGVPGMRSAFPALAELESLEAGENALAYNARTVIRQHLLGHPIESGPKAGMPSYHMKQTRADAVQAWFKGKHGLLEVATNFDHEIKTHWVDPKLFDASKWESALKRLMWWSGPVGFMLAAETIAPFLLPLLRSEITELREEMAEFFAEVLPQAFGIPAKAEYRFRNDIFQEGRVAAEMQRFLVQQGPLSLRSALELQGHDPEQEQERKRQEALTPSAYLPLFDAAHGQDPASGNGRPPGSKDPQQG